MAEHTLPPLLAGDFACRLADDPVKTELELTCTRCQAYLCDVEPDDDLYVLVSVATEHVCDAATGTDNNPEENL